jgi:hypothetical protein
MRHQDGRGRPTYPVFTICRVVEGVSIVERKLWQGSRQSRGFAYDPLFTWESAEALGLVPWDMQSLPHDQSRRQRGDENDTSANGLGKTRPRIGRSLPAGNELAVAAIPRVGTFGFF